MFTKLQTKGTNVRKSIKGAVDVILTDLLFKKGAGGRVQNDHDEEMLWKISFV